MDTLLSPIHVTARTLGVPESWLRAEATSGRIPYLRVGRRYMFSLDLVQQAVLDVMTPAGRHEGAQGTGAPMPERTPVGA